MFKKIAIALTLTLAMVVAFLPEQVDARRRRATLRVFYKGRKPYARCFINGRAFGKIYRGSSKLFRVRRGRTHRVRMTFAGRSRTRSIYFSHRANHRAVTFYRP